MSPRTPRCRHLVALSVIALVFGTRLATAEPIYAITVNNTLISFDSATPGTIATIDPVSGLTGGESILGIDFRPATGQLYALGSGSNLYTLNLSTAAATQVSGSGAFTLSGTAFGMDFNPTVDRLRVTSNADQNLRLNPNDGALTATDSALQYDLTTVDGDPIDPNAGFNPNIVGSAYTNNFAGAVTSV